MDEETYTALGALTVSCIARVLLAFLAGWIVSMLTGDRDLAIAAGVIVGFCT